MKYFTYLIVVISFFLLIFINRDNQTIIKNQTIIMSELTELQTSDSLIINHFISNDTLYWNHLTQCSFISNKQVKIDKRGYTYVTNRKAWNIN